MRSASCVLCMHPISNVSFILDPVPCVLYRSVDILYYCTLCPDMLYYCTLCPDILCYCALCPDILYYCALVRVMLCLTS
jgi:hypothetical protein